MKNPITSLLGVGGGLTSNPSSGAVSDGYAAVTGAFISPQTYQDAKGLKALQNNPGQGGDSVVMLEGSAGFNISPWLVAGAAAVAGLMIWKG